jgi:hypothetical protein
MGGEPPSLISMSGSCPSILTAGGHQGGSKQHDHKQRGAIVHHQEEGDTDATNGAPEPPRKTPALAGRAAGERGIQPASDAAKGRHSEALSRPAGPSARHIDQ